MNPSFSPNWAKQALVFREPHAQPIVTLGYRERIPPMNTGIPGVLLANTTQIFPEDRGTNYSVELGNSVAGKALALSV